jgi:DNA-binding response OmpR family regulator
MPAAYSPLDQILDAVWKETAFVGPRSMDVYVRKLCFKTRKSPAICEQCAAPDTVLKPQKSESLSAIPSSTVVKISAL